MTQPSRYSCVWIRGVLMLAALVCGTASAFAQTIAGGSGHTVVLKSDGTVWTVGDNGSGQLGDNTQTDRKSPVQVSALTGIVAVASGSLHSMALTSAGNLYLWGDNTYGQIGDGSTTMRKTPVQSSLTNVVAVAGGSYFSIALRSNGDVYTWGRDNVGQLGDGTAGSTNTTSPALLTTGAAAIAAGREFALVVKTDGTVYGTGENSDYQLGTGTNTDRSTLGQMSGITTAIAAAGGISHSLILLSDGTVKGVGYNNYGNLGDGYTTLRTSPVSVANLSNVTAIAAGSQHGVARKSDGTVWAWGRNHVGQIGNDDLGNDALSPVQLTSLSSIASIGASSHSIAVTTDGVVYAWGYNFYYQLGDGTDIDRPVPTPISEAGYDWKTSTPMLDVASGTYTTTKNVKAEVTMAGATIRYTQNGNEPTESDPSVASGSTVSVTTSQTLKVKAFKSGMPASNTESRTYELRVASVSFSPSTGTYTSSRTVTMSTSTGGTTIRYTTDGSTPTETSTLYTSAITVATYTVVKAVAFKTDWTSSTPATATYTFNYGTVPTPTADNGTGNYVDSVTVTLSDTLAGTTIRYTTNGSAVQPTSTIYTAPLVFDTTKTLKFKAYHLDYATASAEVTHTYTLSPAAPSFDPTGGTYVGGQLVTVSGSTTGATIYYTTNGAEPTESDLAIASGSTLVVGNYTLKAKAFKASTTPSATTTAAYTISGSVTPPVIAAGHEYSLAIRSDGVAWGWGENTSGQTGYGSSSAPLLLPKTVDGITGAAAIDGGDTHSHLLTTGGTLWTFGDNGSGRLGDGTTTDHHRPVTITGVSAVVSASDGHDHTVALKGDGTVYAWGENMYGQVGDGTTTDRLSPTQVPSLSSVSAISAGEGFSLALKQDGTIVSWGRNNSGQLGRGNTTNSSSPVSVSSISTATAVAAGYQHALALLSDGTLRAWGLNTYGQLGNGDGGFGTIETSAIEVAGLDDVIAIAAGTSFSLALKDDGTVWA